MSQFVQVTTTAPSKELAQALARALVDERLAACVQVAGPIESIYRWQGTIETASEWHCFAKTRVELLPDVEATIRRLHTYTEPEVIATPIVGGSASYLNWLERETTPGGE